MDKKISISGIEYTLKPITRKESRRLLALFSLADTSSGISKMLRDSDVDWAENLFFQKVTFIDDSGDVRKLSDEYLDHLGVSKSTELFSLIGQAYLVPLEQGESGE